MSERTTVTSDPEGRPVVAKAARSPSEARELAREAEVLQAARHPGVVEIVGIDGHGGLPVLLTAHVDGPTLATVGPLPTEEAAGLVAALASTLADLHELGLVHGAVRPDHVVVGPGGRPVLCGFAYGGREGDVAPPPPERDSFADPSRRPGHPLRPAFDVFGLGALIRFLVPAPPPGHVLGRLIDQTTVAEPDARPVARAVADTIQREVPAARFPRALAPPPAAPAGGAAPDPLEAWRRRWSPATGLGRGRPSGRAVAATSGVVVVAAVAFVALARGATPAARPGADGVAVEAPVPETAPPPSEAGPDPTTTRVGPATATTSAGPTCPEVTALLQADVDGDGCADALRYADGILVAGQRRWSVGQPGDQVATGDWACQGTRTLALLHPATGDVFRFDGWAAPGHDVSVKAAARVEGGQALRTADLDHDGCHELVVERATGGPEIVRLPAAGR